MEDQSFRVNARGGTACGRLGHVQGGKHMPGGGRVGRDVARSALLIDGQQGYVDGCLVAVG